MRHEPIRHGLYLVACFAVWFLSVLVVIDLIGRLE